MHKTLEQQLSDFIDYQISKIESCNFPATASILLSDYIADLEQVRENFETGYRPFILQHLMVDTFDPYSKTAIFSQDKSKAKEAKMYFPDWKILFVDLETPSLSGYL